MNGSIAAAFRRLCIATLLTPLGWLGACRPAPEPLVVVCTVDPAVAGPVLEAFEAAGGPPLQVRFVPATAAALEAALGPTQGAAAGDERGSVDLVWSADAAALQRALDRSGALGGSAPAVRSLLAAPRGVAYDPDRVAAPEVPRLWTDLTRDWWRDRLAMPDPAWSTTATHLGAMRAYWERRTMPGYFGAVLEGLAENRIALLEEGDRAVLGALLAGEFDLGVVDLDLASGLLPAGTLRLAVLAHDSDPGSPIGGAWRNRQAVAVLADPVAGAARHAAAQRLGAWIAQAIERDAEGWAELDAMRSPLRDEGAEPATADAVAETRRRLRRSAP